MPVIEKISIHGFKSIAECADLELRSINVLIGPNGAGKSNFIGVFSFLHAIREGHLQNYTARSGGADRLLHFGSKQTSQIDLRVIFQDELNQYRVILSPTDSDELIPSQEVAYFWNRAKYSEPYSVPLNRNGKEAGISDSRVEKTAAFVREQLARWRVYHFHDTSASSPMKKLADLHDNRFLRPDGSNLASFLYFLRERHEPEYQLIRSVTQQVAPFFDDFELHPAQLNPNSIRLEWRHVGSDAYFDAASLSDGTLRFMALATLFLQPVAYRPSVILVDEPELGLHPSAITMFASLVRQASTDTQVILSTQSPILLDNFEPEDVLVADRKDNATVFSRLDPARLQTWLEDFSLGQLWEKNEIGGRPGGY